MLMGFDDGPVHTGGQAKIVRINDESAQDASLTSVTCFKTVCDAMRLDC